MTLLQTSEADKHYKIPSKGEFILLAYFCGRSIRVGSTWESLLKNFNVTYSHDDFYAKVYVVRKYKSSHDKKHNLIKHAKDLLVVLCKIVEYNVT